MLRLLTLAAFVLGSSTLVLSADEKPEARKGVVTGVVTEKGKNFIAVKADGEEQARKYTPHWSGGLPKDGGGLDKKMLAEIKKTPLKARVRLEWSYEERPRVEKIEVLSAPNAPEKK